MPGSCRGRYHTDRQPRTLQYTARCPVGPGVRAASAGAQSHIDQLTVIRPGLYRFKMPRATLTCGFME